MSLLPQTTLYRELRDNVALFHIDVAGNVLPKYRLLQKFGFYSMAGRTEMLGAEFECCGAYSPE